MKKSFHFLLCLLGILLGFPSCEKNNNNVIDVDDEITVYGNVIDRNTGQPLYNVLIEEKNKVGGSTVTGNDGNYEFTLPLNGSKDGKYYLVASKNKYTTSQYELDLSTISKKRNVKVDFQLSPSSIVYTGVVTDADNLPLADVLIKEVNYALGNTLTDAEGKYSLELSQPSDYENWSYELVAYKENYVELSYRLYHSIDDLGYSFTRNFTLTTAFVTITGRVTDNFGSPISDVVVKDMIYGVVGYDVKESATTNIKGEYTLQSTIFYSSGETHFYEPSKVGYKYNERSHRIDLRPGDEGKTYQNVDFVLTKQ